MQRATRTILIIGTFLALAIIGCTTSTEPATETAAAVTATSVAVPTDMLPFYTSSYNATVAVTRNVPNTQIRYVTKSNDLFELNINGLQAFRRPGDRVDWSGLVASGLYTSYGLLLSAASETNLFVQGPVNITVFNPQPAELQQLPILTTPGVFSNLQIQYTVPRGQPIPGTTLVYEGVSGQTVQFSGTSQYPYYNVGSSLLWLGQLRPAVYLRYDLIVGSATDSSVLVSGVGEMTYQPYVAPLQAVPR